MNITFKTETRVRFPEVKHPKNQSVYFFNQYRAGSSVVEAAAEAFCRLSGFTPNNITALLYAAGVELFDAENYEASAVYLSDNGSGLLRLCDFGGYLNYGFREVPLGFSEGFTHVAAAMLFVRDPRDIAISHYRAIVKHQDGEKIIGDHIRAARKEASGMSLEEYVLSDGLINFVRRICMCYAPMIRKGVQVVHYEQCFSEGRYDIGLLCQSILARVESYLPVPVALEDFVANTKSLIANSKSLQGHGTGGKIAMYVDLPDAVRSELDARLSDCLDLLGYS